MQSEIITGLFGCNCHPFKSWEECDREHQKQLTAGQKVRHRCNGWEGRVHQKSDSKGFVLIRFPDNIHQQHVADLVVLT